MRLQRNSSKNPDTLFNLAGGFDPNPSAIKYHQIKTFIDNKDINYLGQVNDPEVLNDCKFYVLPSYRRNSRSYNQRQCQLGDQLLQLMLPVVRKR